MRYEDILRELAPCGLDCGRCADFEQGEIKELSGRLLELLGNYGRLAALRADARPEFAGYEQFEAVLASLARASCSGCRGQEVHCALNCQARTCHREKRVDYCFQCPQYPCPGQFAGMPLRKRWLALNDRMREIGVEEFFEEQRKTPRYPGKIS